MLTIDQRYAACLAIALRAEGGYVNDPQDPGGATNFGVTQAIYDAWRRSQHLPVQSVRAITQTEVSTIYRLQYWNAVRGDELFPGLDLMLFNIGIMDGPVKAIKILQESLGFTGKDVDGQFGLHTMDALYGVNDRAGLIGKVCGDEMGFLRTLKTWWHFGPGWGNRYAGLKGQSLAMLRAS